MKLSEYVKIMGIDLREVPDDISADDLRIVANEGTDMLEALDDGTEVMDVPLRLNEACTFSFCKHVDAIVGQEQSAREEHEERYTRLNPQQENAREYDRRYKERPGNRTRYGTPSRPKR